MWAISCIRTPFCGCGLLCASPHITTTLAGRVLAAMAPAASSRVRSSSGPVGTLLIHVSELWMKSVALPVVAPSSLSLGSCECHSKPGCASRALICITLSVPRWRAMTGCRSGLCQCWVWRSCLFSLYLAVRRECLRLSVRVRARGVGEGGDGASGPRGGTLGGDRGVE